jgi:DNA-binding transcriptional LysR family regulator
MNDDTRELNRISILGNTIPRRMKWDDTRAFLVVARLGTLSAGATALGVGVATLSRRIERLEAALKLPLFVRQQSGYQLTEDGAELLEKAEAMEMAALVFTSGAVARAEVAGRVRLATAETLATIPISSSK